MSSGLSTPMAICVSKRIWASTLAKVDTAIWPGWRKTRTAVLPPKDYGPRFVPSSSWGLITAPPNFRQKHWSRRIEATSACMPAARIITIWSKNALNASVAGWWKRIRARSGFLSTPHRLWKNLWPKRPELAGKANTPTWYPRTLVPGYFWVRSIPPSRFPRTHRPPITAVPAPDAWTPARQRPSAPHIRSMRDAVSHI